MWQLIVFFRDYCLTFYCKMYCSVLQDESPCSYVTTDGFQQAQSTEDVSTCTGGGRASWCNKPELSMPFASFFFVLTI